MKHDHHASDVTAVTRLPCRYTPGGTAPTSTCRTRFATHPSRLTTKSTLRLGYFTGGEEHMHYRLPDLGAPLNGDTRWPEGTYRYGLVLPQPPWRCSLVFRAPSIATKCFFWKTYFFC